MILHCAGPRCSDDAEMVDSDEANRIGEPKPHLVLSFLDGEFAVCRLDASVAVPAWALDGPGFRSVTRTDEEISIVCRRGDVPAGVVRDEPWRCVKVHGPFAFDTPGVLSSLIAPLADRRLPVLTIATYDTDYLLVQAGRAEEVQACLTAAGHRFVESDRDGPTLHRADARSSGDG